MKHYQDVETGKIYSFEDDFNPFGNENRNIPKSLTDIIKQKPGDSYVWYESDWVKKEDAPPGYKPPISRVPSYNPAWMAYIQPYTAVHQNKYSSLGVTIDEVNQNSYKGDMLSKVVATLPLGSNVELPALISYDGAIAIAQCEEFPDKIAGLSKLNELLCSVLLGGIHAEVIHPDGLVIGTLQDNENLFAYNSSIHTSLRLNRSAISERLAPLMHPRIINVDDLRKAFRQGQKIFQVINNLSPIFLLGGYTAMVRLNNGDALNNLWITVEQLTEFIWSEKYIYNLQNFPSRVRKSHQNLKKKNHLKNIYAKHRQLRLAKFLNRNTHKVLEIARNSRNEIVHAGIVPKLEVIELLWRVLPELLEVASGVKSLGIRRLRGGGMVENWNAPERTNFDAWIELASKFPS